MRTRTRRILTTYGMAMLIGIAVLLTAIFGALAVYQGDANRQANCEEIEVLKSQLRPPPFDLEDTETILRDLNIDPESENGKRLIARGRENTARERALLAPGDC